ncbi:uncharacterized protein N7496_005002 [Penicillium cataractarum]|uniref:Uncharacterized protein n=1 Tax=Penicillium cataractarum TaxID=2100454 RepID=A0A9W9SJR4_9EURO|nr:uncharacterized protein N7496_005002 [Penicillium cataractarum]KAJ5377593.1 hypothetical protein N7496_005002 [Penicillium cataractarum]
MPRRKEKRKKEDAAIDSVPESPPKKAKKAAGPTAERPNMPLSSASIKKTIKGTSWHGPPPRLSRGPHQAAEEAKKKEKKKKEEEEHDDEEDDEEDKDEKDEEVVDSQPQQDQRKGGLSPRTREKAAWLFFESDGNEGNPSQTGHELLGLATLEIDADKCIEFQRNCGMITDESGKLTYPVLKQSDGKVVEGPSALRAMYIKRNVVMANTGKKTLDKPTMNTAIMLYYRYKLKGLTWPRDGTVTYWYDGGQVCEPKVYDPEEHRKLAEKYGSIWVEGLSVPFYVVPRL